MLNILPNLTLTYTPCYVLVLFFNKMKELQEKIKQNQWLNSNK